MQGVIYELARQCFGARVDIKELAVTNEDLAMDHEVKSVGGRNVGLMVPARSARYAQEDQLFSAAGRRPRWYMRTDTPLCCLQACLISFPTVAKVEDRPRSSPTLGDLIGISPEAFYQLNPFRKFVWAASSGYVVPMLSA